MLRVHSIFLSVQGEVNSIGGQGTWTVFLRLAGCSVGCSWCFGIRPGRKKPRVILSSKANKKINEVKVGDKLLTFDSDMNQVETEVKEVHRRKVNFWYRLKINGTEYFVTEEHPFFTTRGLVKAENLKIGDKIRHSSFNNKLSFRMLGNKNPTPAKVEKIKRTKIIDYINLIPIWGILTKEQKEKVRKELSFYNRGKDNGNFSGNSGCTNNTSLKELCRKGILDVCQSCSKKTKLEVHHIDCDDTNDSLENQTTLCHSCHTKIHKKGYNFWKNGNRTDGKILSVASEGRMLEANGYEIEDIKYFNRDDYPSSTKPKPLQVFNLTCAPYNTYLVDYMWVHNCDTEYSHDPKNGKEMAVKEIMETILKVGYGCKSVTITGGEPLEQVNDLSFKAVIDVLALNQYRISIETAGTTYVPSWLRREPMLRLVVDYKPKSANVELSEEQQKQIAMLRRPHVIKFPIMNVVDYAEAANFIMDNFKDVTSWERPYFYLSPILGLNGKGCVSPQTVFNWVKIDPQLVEMDVGINLQLHKFLFTDKDHTAEEENGVVFGTV